MLRDDAALETGVDGDLLQRSLDRDPTMFAPVASSPVSFRPLESLDGGLQQPDATARDDALFDRGLGVAHGILDAVLALLELHLGGGSGLDHRDAAGQLGQPLLQLLAVVVRVRLLDLGADLVDPAGDLLGVAGAVDDGGLVLGDDDLAGGAEQGDVGVLQLEPDVLGDTVPPVRIAMSCSMALRRSPKPGALTATDLKVPRILLTTRVASASPSTSSAMISSGLPRLDDLLEQRQQVLDGRDLRAVQQDVGILQNGLLALQVGGEVQRDCSPCRSACPR